MAENDQGQEKTEQPTAKKMQELLEGGQFAKSQEVSTLVLLVLALMVFTIMAPRMVETFRLFLVNALQQMSSLRMNVETFPGFFRNFMSVAGSLILPVMFAGVMAGVIGAGSQSKFQLSPKAIEPKFSKLSPLKGFKNIFSRNSIRFHCPF